MKAAIAFASCLAFLVLVLATRGVDDWSRTFGIAWYGLFAIAAMFGFGSLVAATTNQGAFTGKRALTVAIALPALIVAGMIAYAIVTVARSVS